MKIKIVLKSYLSLTKLLKVVLYNFLKVEIGFIFINNQVDTNLLVNTINYLLLTILTH